VLIAGRPRGSIDATRDGPSAPEDHSSLPAASGSRVRPSPQLAPAFAGRVVDRRLEGGLIVVAEPLVFRAVKHATILTD